MLVLFVTSCCAVGQVTADDPLYKEIMRGDSLIFEVAFNDCQVEALYEVSEDDFEFYHDQGGFTSGQKSFVQSMKNNICALDYRPYRKLNLEDLVTSQFQDKNLLGARGGTMVLEALKFKVSWCVYTVSYTHHVLAVFLQPKTS